MRLCYWLSVVSTAEVLLNLSWDADPWLYKHSSSVLRMLFNLCCRQLAEIAVGKCPTYLGLYICIWHCK